MRKRHMKPKSPKAKRMRKEYLKLKKDLDIIRDDALEILLVTAIPGFNEEKPWDEIHEEHLKIFYDTFEAYFKRIVKYFKEVHGVYLDYRHIDYKKLLYDDDGLTFEERLDKHIKKCINKEYTIVKLGNAYDKILLTEQSCIYHELQSYAFDDDEFVVFEFVGGCEKCTEEYVDGEIYRHDECEEGSGPPYHPACQCFFIDFIAEDDELRDLFPEYDYEGEK